ncbi:DUF6691 family protein [Pseudahrensia aquimaris]|uniref:DUF6691 family protein n=1 Tax=Pseudahrensia aquimaris TaxID=744461 RepID=A0ABW3FAA9_9HYPH
MNSIKIGFAAFLCGALFGVGALVSGMSNPAKVISFFNIFGDWDPSLALVMASALGVTFLGYKAVLGNQEPVLADKQMVPTSTQLDSPLIAGAVIFGAGWGIGGLCPGPALAAFGIGGTGVTTFVFAMLFGIGFAKFIARNRVYA